ncbi:MAG: OsmC family protein [Weeksellaceae bacterium]|nr:OsmC family protein [Weeksellaceae bacterium]
MTSTVLYKGNLRTEMTHIQSKTVVETDAPVDNNGKGERFSPTDLVATALGSCMLTIIGIACNTHQINIDGTSVEITKIMQANPRRIGEIVVTMTLKGQAIYSEKEQKIIEHAALTCPVYLSLHEEVKKTVSFIWPN